MTPTPASAAEIAQSRPRIRKDVLFTRTESGVLFHNAHGGFNVVTRSAYRFAALIVPHLTGERRVDELCAGLGDKQRDMVVQLVGALYARGFARDAVPGTDPDALPPAVAARFAHQIDYLDHYADDAPGRFLRLRSTSVAVLGDDAPARWAALGLLRNGCAAVARTGQDAAHGTLHQELHGVSDHAELDAEVAALTEAGCAPRLTRLAAPADGTYGWADLDGWDTVLVTGAHGPRQITRLLAEGVPAGRRLLAAWTFGNRAVIGPLMTTDTAGCWSCAALRLGASGEAADSAGLWASVGPAEPLGPPAPTLTGPLAGMLGNLLAFEVFRLVTGALPAETRQQVIVQDLDSLDVLTEPLLPHPRCPYCATTSDAAELAGLTAEALRGQDEPATPAAGEAADEDAGRAALAALEQREVLVHEAAGVFSGFADDQWEQTPLKVSTVRLGTSPGRTRRVSAADVHHVAGARLTALFRAAEVYTEHVVPPRVLDGPGMESAAAKWSRVAPAELAVSSGLDVDADHLAHWCEAASLLGGEPVLVPVGAVRTLGGWNDLGLFERSSAGTGVADSPRAALSRALRTALAQDALRGAVRRAAPVYRVDPAVLGDDPELVFLLRSAGHLGADVELLDLTAAGGGVVPVVLARFTDATDGVVRWATGCAPDPHTAMREALCELLGAEQLRRAVDVEPDTGDPLWPDLDAAVLVAEAATAGPPAATTWAAALDVLAAAGRDVYVVPVDAPDLAAGRLHAVRVLLTVGERRAR
jgi:bacteriocin biosynthesis cyclodehydratase domain-containing protein